MANKKGRQTPTKSVFLRHCATLSKHAVAIYSKTNKTLLTWQTKILDQIMAVDKNGLWVHMKFGLAVPRRNGKNEVIAARELFGLINGEAILHTAHRTTTSHSAFERLCKLLKDAGYKEVTVRTKNPESHTFIAAKQFGLEKITILDEGGGTCDFRTRTSSGGLGEGFDLLIIDEAQEYDTTQESTLQYVVSSSPNPQTIMCGTPPTTVSKGDVFKNYRNDVLAGELENCGWAEWSVENQVDPNDVKSWYLTNPSLGTVFLTERNVRSENKKDAVDFNIQRLGFWLNYNLRSDITQADWDSCLITGEPKLTGKLYVGVKYGRDAKNVALAVAAKTTKGDIFVEVMGCKSIRSGNDWILSFIANADVGKVLIDGASGQSLLKDEMKKEKLITPDLPSVNEFIEANALFEKKVFAREIKHAGQPSLNDVVTNCQKRSIGTRGGFGYQAIRSDTDIVLMDSVILAAYACNNAKEKRKQKVSY